MITASLHGSSFAFFTAVLGLFSLIETLHGVDRPKPKICIGTSGTLSVPANRTTHFLNLRDRYQNCTYVDGNLELTWLDGKSLDLSFLRHIQEVTGYVLISYASVERIALPSLQIIRGRTLFRVSERSERFALLVTMSSVRHLQMPALRDILAGSVGLFDNRRLCHARTINWREIISDDSARFVLVDNSTIGGGGGDAGGDEPAANCSRCHASCAAEAGCWGPARHQCQTLSKLNCSPQCHGGRCFGRQPRQCCHLFCAGGCTGPTQSECLACRNFNDDGVCKQECPSMRRYDQTAYTWRPNPDGKLAYGATCVRQCPPHLLNDNSACVRECPAGRTAVNGSCVACVGGACPKTCRLDEPVHSGNIDLLRNCTVLQGSLLIHEHSFDGFQEIHADYSFGRRHARMHPSRLAALSSLRQITGFVYIDAFDDDFRDLSFLRSLEVIGGRYRFDVYFALYIAKTSLRSLRLRALREISAGSVKIVENAHLCYADRINWSRFLSGERAAALSPPRAVVGKNRNSILCASEGSVCDSECGDEGCWGPGSNSCLSCRHYRADSNCVSRCHPDHGLYRASADTCGACDRQCDGACTGAGPRRCVRCRHVRDGPVCLPVCPSGKYPHGGGSAGSAGRGSQCRRCHDNCVGGCTGPLNTVGAGGCRSCEAVVVADDGQLEYCLPANASCPVGFYREYVGPQRSGPLLPVSGKSVCRRCHPRCKQCTGYGFHVSACQECVHYRNGEQCENTCAEDYFADEARHICVRCAAECRGCFGPGADKCRACRNYRIYTDAMHADAPFNCTDQCPSSHPHKVFPEYGDDPFCSSDANARQLVASAAAASSSGAARTLTAVAAAAAVTLLAAAAAVVVVCKCRLDKRKEDMLKMTMMMSKEALNEPLKPTHVRPNLAQLRIVKEVELRRGGVLGYGAFGTVFKGVWVPEQQHVKVPVAIKVLRADADAEVDSSSKQILEEAYVMASLEHTNLLPLLAICMTSQLMLVTQLMPLGCLLEYVRANRRHIGSKPLLNWCTQIARGMTYLEQRRLVHRDLAARNVLVQNPNLVKITDFGLAKVLDVHECEYRADGGKMPIKWLALECIRHRVFTHKSDVWAFGVTVWELLSLGGRPYEHVPAKQVPELLEKGERLPQPACCSIEVYMLMVKCWMLDADSRPAFAELSQQLAAMARDPGRYLVIAGDRLMRLPSYTPHDEQRLVRRLALPALDGPADVLVDAAEYLSPAGGQVRQATDGSGDGNGDCTTDSDGGEANTRALPLYCRQPNDVSGELVGSNLDHPTTPTTLTTTTTLKTAPGVGAVKAPAVSSHSGAAGVLVQLPLDEDDYLMPSAGSSDATSYMDLYSSHPTGVFGVACNSGATVKYHMTPSCNIDPTSTTISSTGGGRAIVLDNPEYHLMAGRTRCRHQLRHQRRHQPVAPPSGEENVACCLDDMIARPPTPSYGYLSPASLTTLVPSGGQFGNYAASPNAVGVPVPAATVASASTTSTTTTSVTSSSLSCDPARYVRSGHAAGQDEPSGSRRNETTV